MSEETLKVHINNKKNLLCEGLKDSKKNELILPNAMCCPQSRTRGHLSAGVGTCGEEEEEEEDGELNKWQQGLTPADTS